MIRRILMALLVLGVAFPALAAPLGHWPELEPAPMATTHHHDHQRHTSTQSLPGHSSQHDCIGCIVNLALPEVPPPFAILVAAPGMTLTPVMASTVGKPDTPPPKS